MQRRLPSSPFRVQQPSAGYRLRRRTDHCKPTLRPQKIRGKSPKSGETSNPLIPGNFAEACSGSNPDFEVEFRTVREAKAESSARELRVLQLPLIDGLEGLTHTAFKFAAVAATGKVAKLWGRLPVSLP